MLELDPNVPTINVDDGNMRGFETLGRAGYWIMTDAVSEGYEVELNLTPVRNWNIRANGSKSTAQESDIGAPWFEWVDLRLPVWRSVVATNGEVDAEDNPVTFETAPINAANPTGQTLAEYFEGPVSGSLAFIQALDGRATDSARGARANLITNYRFTSGRLSGFSIGGAARWRAAPTIGYGVTPEGDLDLDQEYKGKEELYFDLLCSYRGRMKAFGGFSYRLQLNMRNALNEDDPIPTKALTTGEVYRIAVVQPRVTTLTFSVEF